MNSEQYIPWIFLSIASASQTSPVDFNGISMVADGINHAVPTNKELQTSVAWLLKHELILKHGNKYNLSEKGKNVFEEAQIGNGTYLKIWAELEKKLKAYN